MPQELSELLWVSFGKYILLGSKISFLVKSTNFHVTFSGIWSLVGSVWLVGLFKHESDSLLIGLLGGEGMGNAPSPYQAQFPPILNNSNQCAVTYPYQKLCSMHVTFFRTLFRPRLDPNQNKQSAVLLYGLS